MPQNDDHPRRAALRLRAERAAARRLDRLSDATKLRLSGRRQISLDGQWLDPGVQLTLALAQRRGGATLIDGPDSDVAQTRAYMRAETELSQGVRTPVGAVTELQVPGDAGPLRARHYAPVSGATGAGLLVFLHGGGWVIGDLDTHDEVCRLLCVHAGVHVVSVDYRLAPEHPFPAAPRDAVAAVAWALEHAASLGADPARVAVGGDSAGGTLAAVSCQQLALEGRPLPALQVLIYPGADLTLQTASRRLFGSGFLLDTVSIDWFTGHYLPAGADRTDPRISPLRGELAGLPPAIVVTAAFDPLRDEGEAYAGALREAGVRVAAYRAPGMIHGFINLSGVSRSARDGVIVLAGMVRAELGAAVAVAVR